MWRRYILLIGLAFLFLLSQLACGDGATGPDENLEFNEFSVNNPPSLFELLGINMADLQSYFLVDWTSQVEFDGGTTSPIIRTFARAFTEDQSANNFVFRGVDMGAVSFTHMNSDTVRASIQLGQIFSVAVGFDYRASNNRAPNAFTDGFPYVSSDTYRFTRFGTVSIDSLSIDFDGPSDDLAIIRSASNSAVLGDQDLRISWQGGLATERVLVLLQPVFEFSNGRGFSPGLAEFLTSNPGEFMLEARNVQAFLDNAEEELSSQPAGSRLTGIFVYVALPTITAVSQDGNRSVAIAFTSDQRFIPLASNE